MSLYLSVYHVSLPDPVNLQRAISDLPLRVLVGAGVTRTTIDSQPEDAVETLLRQDYAGGTIPHGWSNHLRGGLIWDTRDREAGPRWGTWTEILVQGVPEFLGSESGYLRWTFADRRYFPMGDRLTFANRFLIQDIDGVAPFYDQYIVQTSFKQQEGLGGAKTLRGGRRHFGGGEDTSGGAKTLRGGRRHFGGGEDTSGGAKTLRGGRRHFGGGEDTSGHPEEPIRGEGDVPVERGAQVASP